MEWLGRVDAGALDDNLPLCRELAHIADGLGQIRAELQAPGLTALEKTRFRTQEAKLSQAFVAAWRALGLAVDQAAKEPGRPVGRPPALERIGGSGYGA